MVGQKCCTEVPTRYTINRIPGNTEPTNETYDTINKWQITNQMSSTDNIRSSGGTGEQNIRGQVQTRKPDEDHIVSHFAAFQGPQKFGGQIHLCH